MSAMLVSLVVAFLAVSVNSLVTGLADEAAPIALENPSTLDLALMAAGTLALYASIKWFLRPDRMETVDEVAAHSNGRESSRGAA
jgi:hypothetical protein